MPAFQNPFRRTGATEEEAAESAALVDDDEGEWLAYELHEWALESRSMLAQLLLAEAVVHSWQGTTLLAHGSAEQQVDALIEEVEAATNPELDPDQPQIAFEMDGWSGELQAQLTDRLGAAGVPHEAGIHSSGHGWPLPSMPFQRTYITSSLVSSDSLASSTRSSS